MDMPDLLSDELNLEILRRICAGTGLDVNLRQLSKILRRHRNTVRERVRNLVHHRIVDRPVFPFIALFKEYPLLVLVYADLPDDERVMEWLRTDKHVFAAFRVREGDYNMMLFEFHRSVEEYMTWRSLLVEEGRIPERETRIPSTPYYISNTLIFKYDPNAPIKLIMKEAGEEGHFTVYDHSLDELSIEVLTCLMKGQGIKVNESLLSEQVGVHRATLRRRIDQMLRQNIIHPPICRFPHFFAPPGFILVVSMMEVKHRSRDFEREILNDPHITLAYRISQGRYNLLLFEAHRSLEDYLKWESTYEDKYPDSFGSIKNNYLSPRMALSIDQQKVSLGAIEGRLQNLEKKRITCKA
ncbi:MAG: Lrp/AsnC family transcriptional regulator [Candidatus Bathyarchaeia archaeon]